MKNFTITLRNIILSFVFALIFISNAHTQTNTWNHWVTGYVTSWDLNMGAGTANYGNTPYQSIDLDAMTHVVMFAFGSNADGTLNKTLDWDGTYKYGNLLYMHRRFFNDYVHSKGKPIIITFFGKGGGGDFTLALSSAITRTALVANMMDFLRFEQYDGFDLDIEPLSDADKTNFSIFVKQLSDSLKTGKAYYNSSKPLLLTCAIYNNEQLFASLSPYFDQLNVMSYDLFGDWWGVSWHNNAVYASPTDIQVGTTNNQLATVANKVTQFTKAGIPKNKLGVGIDFNGHIWNGGLLSDGNGVTTPRQQWITPPTKAQFNETRYYDLRKIIDTSTTTLHYDQIAKVPYIGIDCPGNSNDTYILFQDTTTVHAIINVVRDSSIGGVILWEVNGGYLNTTKYPTSQYPSLMRDPLLQAVKHAMNEVPSTPIPSVPSGTLTISSSSLPASGGTVTLTWASTSAISASIDQGVGIVALNGAMNVTVTSTKTFTLTLTNAQGIKNYTATIAVAPPTIPIGNIIYCNAGLSSPWKDVKSWGVTRDYANVSPVYSSASSIKAVHSAWGSLQFTQGSWGSFASIDPTQFLSFDFVVNGGTNGVTLQVSCMDASNKNQMTPVVVTVPANTWTTQSIPMNKLAVSPFTALAMTAGGTTVTFYLDEIRLVPKPPIPTAPVILNPVNFSENQAKEIIVNWNSVNYASKYHLQVSSDSVFQSLLIDSQAITDSTCFVSGLANDTKYFVRVQASNNTGTGNFSNPISFKTIISAPDQPILTSPINDITSVPTETSLEWNVSDRASSYKLDLGTDSMFANLFLQDTSKSTTSFAVSGLNYSTHYFWRVQAKNIGGTSPISTTGSFYTNPPPIPDVVLYKESALNSPWTDIKSWSVTRTYTNASPVYSGTTALSVIHKPWASLQFTQGTWGSFVPFNSNLYSSVRFALHGGTKGVTLTVNCKDASGKTLGLNAVMTAPANAWVTATIPFTQLTCEPFVALTFTAGTSNTTFSLDDIIIVSKSSKSAMKNGESEFNTVSTKRILPKDFELHQNFPNPFNPYTTIRYGIPTKNRVTIRVYSILGQLVEELVNKEQSEGWYETVWNASVASGIYLYRIEATNDSDPTHPFIQMKKMLLLK